MNNIDKYNKIKFFFIGWIIAIIPYILILMMINSVNTTDQSYNIITIILLIIIPLINGFSLSKQASDLSDE